jgi:hypothetical protein
MRNPTENDSVRTEPDAVARFTERLADLDLDEWLTLSAEPAEDAATRSTTFAMLEALIGHLRVGVLAWSVADDVETLVHCVLNDAQSLAGRGHVARLRLARNAARAAALALLMRPQLRGDDFDVLYRPFARLVPL